MLQCPSRAENLADASRICPTCSTPVHSYATRPGPPPRPPSPRPGAGGRREPPSSGPDREGSRPRAARFVAGTIFGERYRIVGRLGGGGMGEVYRAEDVRLGQPV